MPTPRRVLPIVLDPAEVRLRTPVHKADDPMMRESVLPLTLFRVL